MTLRGDDIDGMYSIMSATNAMTLFLYTEEEVKDKGFRIAYIQGI